MNKNCNYHTKPAGHFACDWSACYISQRYRINSGSWGAVIFQISVTPFHDLFFFSRINVKSWIKNLQTQHTCKIDASIRPCAFVHWHPCAFVHWSYCERKIVLLGSSTKNMYPSRGENHLASILVAQHLSRPSRVFFGRRKTF